MPHYDVDLSVVIPVYNEEANLDPLRQDLIPVLEGLGCSFEVVLVDDGSRDRSPEILRGLADEDDRFRVVRFARNYGQQMANTAGLRHARGKTVVIMDADLQTPAENIPAFLEKLGEGYDIVYGVREQVSVPLYRKLGTRFANWLICRMTGFRIPDSASGFLALDRTLVENVNRYNERTRYLSGLFAWLSYGRYAAIPVTRRPRLHGESKYTFWGLARLVINFVTLFSAEPVLLAGLAGLAAWGLALLMIIPLVAAMYSGDARAAELTLDAIILMGVGGTELIFLGLVGAYIGRVYANVRQNPPYVIVDLYDHSGEVSAA